MFVIRKKLFADEGDPPDTRYNPDTDTVETSTDGGITWTENPGADPRINPAYLQPALAAGSRCEAAGGMLIGMKQFVNAMIIIPGVSGMATSILSGMIFLVPGIGWLWALALGIATAALFTGAGVINAAFTTTVWDEILCILYESIDDDGQVSTAQLDEIYNRISTEIGDFVVTTIIGQIFQAWGFVGVSNAGVAYADVAADCTGCVAGWILTYDATVGDGGWFSSAFGASYTAVMNSYWVAGIGWKAGLYVNGANRKKELGIRHNPINITGMTKLRVWMQVTVGVNLPAGTATYIYMTVESPTLDLININPAVSGLHVASGSWGFTARAMNMQTRVSQVNNSTTPTGDATMTRLELSGTGSPPTLPSGAGWSLIT